MDKPSADQRACLVCGKKVAREDEAAHLESNHLGPHYFWFEAVGYRTDKPSMTVAEFLKMMGRTDGPMIFEERNGERIHYAHGQAIDLTHQPQLFVDLPATMRAPPRD